ncbi:helix-turn-helix domain-containing protein [Variovorax sp. dw_308]|uniref:helix-turn-helix domain-containing protein n=1 Tax=Variovorax sp. dw_308 TaxID=2721546 RepID=UPI001C4718D9|nr:helix-turn-helix domain-containing protein [Variovorax sp. dw_308]
MNDISFATRTSRDVDEHATSVSAWDQQYEQLTPGRFEGRTEELRLGPVQLFHESANRAVLQCGSSRPGTHTLGLVQPAGDAGWFCGHPIEADRLLAVSSDHAFELIAGAGMRITGVSIDTAHLRRTAACLHAGDDGPPSRLGPRAVDMPPPVREGLKALIASALSLARQQPALMQQPTVQHSLAQTLTEAALDCIAPGPRSASVRPGAATRRRILHGAREYMRAHVDEPITVPDLCAATGASRRALQYAFEETLQLSPVTYLRVMRLNRVRSELVAQAHATVGDIAARWGFWHPSRFATEYRRHFGELPSATRARRGQGGCNSLVLAQGSSAISMK